MTELKPYPVARAEAIRDLKHLQTKLLVRGCSVEVINRAFNLCRRYNLAAFDKAVTL
ncbi:hypothetical protein KAR91_69830 [Candidatus Pacearchaeota archaeon]|nr:hypothetical protein [Candidatus Pacearchaeota archaeon]